MLMVERSAAGGQAGTSSRIENYLGFPEGVSGDDLTGRALKQAIRFGAEIAMTRCIEKLTQMGGCYLLELDGGERVTARAVLLATGVDWRRLEVAGRGSFAGTRRPLWRVSSRGQQRDRQKGIHRGRRKLGWAGGHVFFQLCRRGQGAGARRRAEDDHVTVPDRRDRVEGQYRGGSVYPGRCR